MKSFLIIICVILFLFCESSEQSVFQKIGNTVKATFTKARPQNQTTFHLYTRLNPLISQDLRINDSDSFRKSNFNKNWPLRILIHGFQSSGTSKMMKLVRDAYFTRGDFNMISVDWSPISRKFSYDTVAKKVPEIASVIAEFVIYLHLNESVPYHEMYLIGHSLGAHIAGITGRLLAPQQVNTIFALDPASPNFKDMDIEDRVDMTDAEYVESIQTNIYDLGFKKPIGHAAFYPNYGQTQPGCNLMHKFGCSHRRSYKFFAESIESNNFWARTCNFDTILSKQCNITEDTNHYVQMGGEPSVPKFGTFYLSTNPYKPYGQGK